MSKTIVFKIGYVIRNKYKNTVWKQPYSTRQEAEAELKSQILNKRKTHPTYNGENWKIESFQYDKKVDI